MGIESSLICRQKIPEILEHQEFVNQRYEFQFIEEKVDFLLITQIRCEHQKRSFEDYDDNDQSTEDEIAQGIL